MKNLLILCLFFSSISIASTEYICNTPDNTLRLTVDNSGVWYQKKIENGQTSQFFMPLSKGSIFDSNIKLEAYSTRIEIEGNLFDSNKGKQSVNFTLFTDNQKESSGQLSCKSFELSKITGKESGFSKNLRKIQPAKEQYYEEFKKTIFYRVNKNYNFSVQAETLVSTLLEIGDWYGFVPNLSQTKKIYKYLNINEHLLMSKLAKYTNMTFEGFIFSRDWYYGEGRIGMVYKKGNKLMLIVIAFDYYEFGDNDMDYSY